MFPGEPAYLAGDSQGTDSVAIDSATLTITRRYYDPYGNPRGTAPPSFPAGQKGFVGGTADTATGLTNLGARQYQPGTGSFITPDPLLSPYDPQDLNPYGYAHDNPSTRSDPSGQCTPGPGNGCQHEYYDPKTGCSATSQQALNQCIASHTAKTHPAKQHSRGAIQISPHVLVATDSSELGELEEDWAWAVKHYGNPKNTQQEFDDWVHACAVGPYRCHGSFEAAFGTGLNINFKTEELWNDGIDMLVEADGKVEPVVEDDLAARLEGVTREALAKFKSGELKFSKPQQESIDRKPSRYNMYKGNLIDDYVKKALERAGDDELYNLYITARFEQGPDVTQLSGLPDYIVWYDFTTKAEWDSHTGKYFDVWGPNGKGIFWDQIEMEMGTEGIGDGGDAGAPGGE